VQKKIDLVNLRANSLISNILYFECVVQFVMFLAVGSVIHFRYVKTLLKLDTKMKRYKNGDILRFDVRSKDEIAQLQASFQQLTQNLYEEKQTQNRIIASISHDIKTPLTSVLGYSERIATKNLNPERLEKYTQIIYKQAMDIEAIINEFDDYLTATITVTTQLQRYSVGYLCTMLKDEYSLQLREQEIEFTVENGCDEEITVMIDLLKLRRIFANIIGNSVRHAGVSHLRIDITAKIETGNVVFTIADNGHGVSDEDLKHIFEPFYTSDKSRRVSGLGLSICKQIMDGIGGEIVAHNNKPGGLSVILRIPILEL
jgi:signal transduction histidine kinase